MSDTETSQEPPSRNRICDITIDERSVARGNSSIEHEREVAIFDILDGNSFTVEGHDSGPYKLEVSVADDRLVLKIANEASEPVTTHQIPMTPLKRLLKDYFFVLDSYYQAIRAGQPSRIEAIDAGRRGLHDEGSKLLQDRLDGKVTLDFDTARRLFTLICALHWRG